MAKYDASSATMMLCNNIFNTQLLLLKSKAGGCFIEYMKL